MTGFNFLKLYQSKEFEEHELSSICSELVQFLDRRTLLILEGPLGAGKTTLTKQLCREYWKLNHSMMEAQIDQLADSIQSPTYSLINEYPSIVHCDFYRIEELDELAQLELELYLPDKSLCLVEWGLNFKDFLFSQIPGSWQKRLLKIDVSSPQSVSKSPARRVILEEL